jgi:conjugal transfer pilin signal peptidase TrbI
MGLVRVLIATALMVLVLYLPLKGFSERYRILYDSVEGGNCLPYSVFLIDLDDRGVRRGEYAAFFTMQLEPFYRVEPAVLKELADRREQRVVIDRRGVMIDGVYRGVAVVKQVSGVPGDHIAVGEAGVLVNGSRKGGLLHASEGGKLWQLGRRVSDYVRDEAVPPGHLWMMGTTERSYDSRYWGYVSDEQVIGRAIPLW